MARYIPGASANPDNGLRIHGADDQFSTYIDGAPIPPSISGSITDVIDPRIIRILDVYTGGFPAQYGGQLSAVFDVTTRRGGLGVEEFSRRRSAGQFVRIQRVRGRTGKVTSDTLLRHR